ncbi:hypothetical protein HYC85_024246 [Camellia sinensis]|uniref:WAT1-related protein n=1 Tax=Camellia sinensis TaxID=4442 RepID=A0A7J7G7J1_CAMSI|nr:hypothetical protein HYC85_024246 [Camellia sinensis]
MGACASVPKSMNGEVGEAPPPEPPKEETTAVVAEANAANKVVTVEEEENKGEGQSLGFLLNESEEVKESPKMEKISETKIAPPKIVRTEEEESEALPISDVVAKMNYDSIVFQSEKGKNEEQKQKLKILREKDMHELDWGRKIIIIIIIIIIIQNLKKLLKKFKIVKNTASFSISLYIALRIVVMMGRIWNSIKELKAAMIMVVVQITFDVVNIFYKMAANDGMKMTVLIAYRFLFASAFILPLALFLERKSRPKLTWGNYKKKKKKKKKKKRSQDTDDADALRISNNFSRQ